MQFGPTFGLADVGGVSSSIRGEATVVDLGDGRYLFVLLNERNGLARIAFSEQLPGPESDYKSMLRSIKRLRGVADVPLAEAPLLVTFGDLSDPASVMRVDPADLAATFGAGFALREITLEVTDDAVTDGVVEGFEFMQRLKSQATLSGLEFFSSDHPDEINYLTDKAFVRKAIK